MSGSPYPKEAVAEILRHGLLFIRAADDQDLARCNLEADHLHNLPRLLVENSIPRLRYYFEVERPDYLARASDRILPGYEASWKTIGDFLAQNPSDKNPPR